MALLYCVHCFNINIVLCSVTKGVKRRVSTMYFCIVILNFIQRQVFIPLSSNFTNNSPIPSYRKFFHEKPSERYQAAKCLCWVGRGLMNLRCVDNRSDSLEPGSGWQGCRYVGHSCPSQLRMGVTS